MNDMYFASSGQEFLSAREIAELAKTRWIAGFPKTERGVQIYARNCGWVGLGKHLCRKRSGRGGGLEYHFSLLPAGIRTALEGNATKAAIAQRQSVEIDLDQRRLDALKASTLSPRARAVMEARAEILTSIEGYAIANNEKRSWALARFLTAQDACMARQEIEARRDQGGVLTAQEVLSLADPLLLTAPHGFDIDPARLKLANDRKASASIKRSALYEWFKARDTAGVVALAPVPPKTKDKIHPGFAGFLKFYAIGSKPTMTDALGEYLKTNPAPDMRITLSQVQHILRKRLNNIEKNVGREGLLTLRARLPYVTRTTDDMWPTTAYTADGKTFDAEIADPVTHRPIRPEITTIMDVATRKIVGISLGRSENQRSVAEALRNACVGCGIPAIFYVDRGPGYKNKAMDADVSGLMGRLGITKTHARPYGSQAKGLIERPNATVWDTLAKRLPTYMGKDMDKEAGDKIHKITRHEIKEFGRSRHLPTWQEFVKLCEDRVEEYNNRPHGSLPRFEDPVTGRWRTMSPNEAWQAHAASGFEPVSVEAGEVDDLFRPYEIRTCLRAEVKWNTNTYFHADLEPYHETRVMVGYDYHQADKVWVREFDVATGQPGRLICVAEFMGNAERYFPLSFEEKALETRTNTRKQRLENKIEAVEDERRAPYLVEQESAFEMPVFEARDPEAIPSERVQLAVDNTAPKPAARARRTFNSDEELAAWALENPQEISRKQADLLRDCLSRSTARELFRLSGIDTEALRTLLRAVA
ncbi:Integrase core domain protein [Aquimixticola soesokkakensis]|uniref:Integrase core domain protein n=1 Tax=Aquimixticola soesokkakensis TaxID=1519096 RepID=A0A1Y5SFI7_9RHOB|nr:Mu transposase C-terminal domain-containing protein [Aquimixticola soesokkakensis]SLN38414.1 Integrase core domain protein [Aquimixticola soesokkakensis]